MESSREVHEKPGSGDTSTGPSRSSSVESVVGDEAEHDTSDEEWRAREQAADELEAIASNANADLEAIGVSDWKEADVGSLGDEAERRKLLGDAGERASWSPAVVDGWRAALGMAHGRAAPPRRSQRIL